MTVIMIWGAAGTGGVGPDTSTGYAGRCRMGKRRSASMSVSETIAARPAPPMPSRRLIDGPSAWVGADMRKREAEWSYRLSPLEVAEIEAALRAVWERGLDIADIRREDFPLP